MSDVHAGSVVVVDDDPYVLESLSFLLRINDLKVRAFTDGCTALTSIAATAADVVVSDINMPGTNGLQLLESLREIDVETPVIFISGNPTLDNALEALRMRAFEFLCKPFEPKQLIAAVLKGIDHKRLCSHRRSYLEELEESVAARSSELAEYFASHRNISREVIQTLTKAAEMRDEDTGAHISRIGAYAGKIASSLGMDEEFVETITLASAMHDIGKIAIPDAILFKAGPLTSQEFDVIKMHTVIGSEILKESSHPVLKMASTIALTHHERWDGSGYPHGLVGTAIPLEGRIAILADQYDALRSSRPYKLPYDHETAVGIISRGDGRTMPSHFDPCVMEAFLRASKELADIYDAEASSPAWDATASERMRAHAAASC